MEDLVIGGDPDDPNTAFYRPSAVVAAENGNIFVVERGGKRVQMFAPDGEFLETLGKEGQGPGEFQQPTEATIAGEHLVVLDMGGRRLSVWTDEGKHVADHATTTPGQPSGNGGHLSTGTHVPVPPGCSLAHAAARSKAVRVP